MRGEYKVSWLQVQVVQNVIVELSPDEIELLQGWNQGFLDAIVFRGPRALRLRKYTRSSDIPDLYTMLSTFWTSKATDPRDKIYALIGLTTARDNLDLVIDYSAPIGKVFLDATKYILVSSRKLDVICSLPRGENSFDLPSWVPDWTIHESRFGSPFVWMVKTFRASGDSTARTSFGQGDRILNAEGFRVSQVQEVGQDGGLGSPYNFETCIPTLISWLKLWSSHMSTHTPEEFCIVIFWENFPLTEGTTRGSSKVQNQRTASESFFWHWDDCNSCYVFRRVLSRRIRPRVSCSEEEDPGSNGRQT
jgi:hypothetical protein